MKHPFTIFMSICLLISLPACSKHEEESQASSADRHAESEGYEPEPEEGIYEDEPQAQSGSRVSFSPEEIRDYCKYVTGNAQNFYNLYTLPFIRGEGPKLNSEEIFSKLEEMYKFDTSLNLSDQDRELMGSTLWVTKAFVANSEGVQRLLQGKNRLGHSFTQANQQWCQKSMRGDQPSFEYLGSVVPYVEFQRN